MKIFIRYIILFSLICSVTNYVPFSLTVLLFLPLALIEIFYRDHGLRFKKIEFYLLGLFIYIIFSTLTYNPSSFSEYDFYRRDGNFFITYLVLLVFIFLPYEINFEINSLLEKILVLFLVISIPAYILIPTEAENAGVHHYLFVSHNAAGGFYSVMASMAIGLYLVNRKLVLLGCTLAFCFLLYMSDSRGSILAIFGALAYSIFKFKRPGLVIAIFFALQIVIVNITYPAWVDSGKYMSPEANFTASVNVKFERAGTFVDRLYYLWPRAYDNFLHSPLLGLGFGSYDDLYYEYINVVPHIYAIKEGGITRHSDSHAHNSLLDIMAELGLLGISLYVLLFSEINKKIVKIKSFNPGLSKALSLSLWTCVFSAATEHRITTPAQMVPFFILFGMAYVKYFKKKNVEIINHIS
ncbi:O-antigen ligase family protein [Sodalis sp. RH19]|uniref:O-antigen ligase family protein n=1 Tax=Sodalis sp. RH19 TaxID=3394334 RepID=UPI0039B5374A